MARAARRTRSAPADTPLAAGDLALRVDLTGGESDALDLGRVGGRIVPPSPQPDGLPLHWFDYDLAFSRNIGWISELEQQKLREARIAIAGMGGVGGVHMLTLARLGIGRFSVADFDRFEVGNFNRQVGATAQTVGQPKAESVIQMARQINPELQVASFESGLSEDNLEAFLEGVDVYIDGLDFFVLDVRRKLFALARRKGIPAITAGPLGFGTGYLIFTPDGMSFEDYFRFEGKGETDRYVQFLMGLTPSMMHRAYLVDGSRTDLLDKRGPSTAIACQLCAGVAAAEATKLILGRGDVYAAPYYHHFDPYRGAFLRQRLEFGNGGPVQRAKSAIVSRLVGSLSRAARPREVELPMDAPLLTRVLEAARWAPSPDNSQPWRFTRTGESSLSVSLDLEKGNPYQYRQSEPNWLAAGMLVGAMRLAAGQYGMGLHTRLEAGKAGPLLQVRLKADKAMSPDPLANYIKVRSVDRGSYKRRALTPDDRTALEAALGPGFALHWFTSLSQRLAIAWANSAATQMRLRSRACFNIHQKVIDWSGPYSREGLPAQAVGLDPLARRLMQWALAYWPRMKFASGILRADLYAALEMDILPSVQSGGFVVIQQSMAAPDRVQPSDQMVFGERIYRLWLEATRRGLAFQPALAPIFAAAQLNESQASGVEAQELPRAGAARDRFINATGLDISSVVFQARLGYPIVAKTPGRSIRRPLESLETSGGTPRNG